MDFELDLSSENMTSFLELEQEIKEATTSSPLPLPRPSVIVKPRPKPASVQQAGPSPSLADIMTSCGIEYDLPEDGTDVASPSSIHSDIQLDQNQELIEELEEFFIKTEGCPTVVDKESEHPDQLILAGLNDPSSCSLLTAEGQKVIIIIAPSSPAESVSTTTSSDSDPEWSPSPCPLSPAQLSLLSSRPEQRKARKKYARTKPPSPPSVTPYPADKKERKKAQNRTAAFRYREKKKSEQDLAEEELEALAEKNRQLQGRLGEMET